MVDLFRDLTTVVRRCDEGDPSQRHKLISFLSCLAGRMMALLLLILSPLALAAASMSRRQDLPEGATTLAVFEEITSSETYVLRRSS